MSDHARTYTWEVREKWELLLNQGKDGRIWVIGGRKPPRTAWSAPQYVPKKVREYLYVKKAAPHGYILDWTDKEEQGGRFLTLAEGRVRYPGRIHEDLWKTVRDDPEGYGWTTPEIIWCRLSIERSRMVAIRRHTNEQLAELDALEAELEDIPEAPPLDWSEWWESIKESAPEGDFEWDGEASTGDEYPYEDEDGWHLGDHTLDLWRRQGKMGMDLRFGHGSRFGGDWCWDCDSNEFEADETDPVLIREWQGLMRYTSADYHFRGWAGYYIWAGRERADPLEVFRDRSQEDIKEHVARCIKAARENLDYLKPKEKDHVEP